MKPGKIFVRFKTARKLLSERGQSIVEFVLLLAAIASVSFFFVAIMNRNIARYWEYSANLVINDGPGKPKKVTLPQ
jgi:hypothetical protein